MVCQETDVGSQKGASGRRSPTLELVPPCLDGDSPNCSDDGASLTQRDANGCPDGDGRNSSKEGEDVVMDKLDFVSSWWWWWRSKRRGVSACHQV